MTADRRPFIDVRRMAALDMALHGDRLITIEFAVAVAACASLGVLALISGLRHLGQGIPWELMLGVLLVGAALN